MSSYEPRKILALGLAWGLPSVLGIGVIAVAADHYNTLGMQAYIACVQAPATHDVRDCGGRP